MISEEIQRLLHDIQSRDDQFNADFEIFFFRPAYEISPDQPIVQTVSRACQSIRRQAPKYEGMWAWLDSAILAQAGIPTVIVGPSGDGAHAAVEYVAEVLVRSITNFCNQ
jgi:acetylornithine deacetylase